MALLFLINTLDYKCASTLKFDHNTVVDIAVAVNSPPQAAPMTPALTMSCPVKNSPDTGDCGLSQSSLKRFGVDANPI